MTASGFYVHALAPPNSQNPSQAAPTYCLRLGERAAIVSAVPVGDTSKQLLPRFSSSNGIAGNAHVESGPGLVAAGFDGLRYADENTLADAGESIYVYFDAPIGVVYVATLSALPPVIVTFYNTNDVG